MGLFAPTLMTGLPAVRKLPSTKRRRISGRPKLAKRRYLQINGSLRSRFAELEKAYDEYKLNAKRKWSCRIAQAVELEHGITESDVIPGYESELASDTDNSW